MDVVRVLAAVLILGNVGFTDGPGVEVGVIGENELASVAALLGVPPPALLRGLTSRTHNARGQLVKSVCDANMVITITIHRQSEIKPTFLHVYAYIYTKVTNNISRLLIFYPFESKFLQISSVNRFLFDALGNIQIHNYNI